LYLGIASGTTASHLSDIIGSEGHIWGVEFSVKPLQNLIDKVTLHRRNISPIFGDARRPNDYSFLVPMVDVIYADVAQPNQAQIVAQNAEVFLVKEGWAIMAIKARSIDVRKSPLEVYEREVKVLKQSGFTIEELVHLGPFEKDHAIAVAKFHAF
jgi:fibrillarin-like pre-rRNA processing protein